MYSKPMSRLGDSKFEKVFAVRGILMPEWQDLSHSPVFLEKGLSEPIVHTPYDSPNWTFVLDTATCHRLKFVSSHTFVLQSWMLQARFVPCCTCCQGSATPRYLTGCQSPSSKFYTPLCHTLSIHLTVTIDLKQVVMTFRYQPPASRSKTCSILSCLLWL